MIEKLRQIVTRVTDAPDLDHALALAVGGIHAAMGTDACAAYLVDPLDGQLVLREAEGFEPAAIDQVRLAPGEGVAGLVRERRATVNLDNASAHPRFKPFPATGEKQYRGFLGVPMIYRRQVLGVLIVCRRQRRRFGVRQEDFLVTASALLAGALAPTLARSHGQLQFAQDNKPNYVQGVAGAPGVAIGELVVSSPLAELDAVPDRAAADPVIEEAAFREAVATVQTELVASGKNMEELLPSEAQVMFEIYAMLVGDESLANRVIDRIREGVWAPAALRDAISEIAAHFAAMPDERLAARAEDIRAVGRRLLLELQTDERARRQFPASTILIGDEVSLARIGDVPRERLAGIVCLSGSVLSHTTVIARALGIPAIMGLGELSLKHLDGKICVVDGYVGRMFVEPATAVRREFERLAEEEHRLAGELQELRDLPAETADGVRVSLQVNTGLLSDIEPSRSVEPDGVGLYRSEFPFMLRETFPGESEQHEIYRQMLEAFAPRPVVMRTLDIGGDKPLDYFPIDEPNSLLGWRGIRVTLQQPEIFLVQLKAMLRASHGLDNLRVLLPMISQASEVRESQSLLDQAIEDIRAEGLEIKRPPLGVMIEVPLVLYSLDTLAGLVDFFSIGSNDLTQYLTAADRGNPRVASLYDHLDPAVLRALHGAITTIRGLDRPVSVCGELAGDPAGALLLLGMGVDKMSAAAAALPRIKWVIRSFTRARAGALLDQALALDDANEVRRLMHTALEEAGLGGIVRAGR